MVRTEINLRSINVYYKTDAMNVLFDGKRRKQKTSKKSYSYKEWFNEIKECVEKFRELKKVKNEKVIFQKFIISKNEMEKFEKEELKKREKS